MRDFIEYILKDLQPPDVQQLKFVLKDSFTGRFY